MPIIRHTLPDKDSHLGLWLIEEPESFFLNRMDLHKEEQDELSDIKGARRLEWLSSRFLLHLMSKRSIRGALLKDRWGKPYLSHSDFAISLSHSHNISAVIASRKTVGIDIQFKVPKITRIFKKFMSNDEIATMDDNHKEDHMHVVWGAKESLYKAYGRREIDFKRHLSVSPFTLGRQFEFSGRVQKEDYNKEFKLNAENINDYFLVYAIERSFTDPHHDAGGV